jgi:hypothetical protein
MMPATSIDNRPDGSSVPGDTRHHAEREPQRGDLIYAEIVTAINVEHDSRPTA